jgi:hypothetical protein
MGATRKPVARHRAPWKISRSSAWTRCEKWPRSAWAKGPAGCGPGPSCSRRWARCLRRPPSAPGPVFNRLPGSNRPLGPSWLGRTSLLRLRRLLLGRSVAPRRRRLLLRPTLLRRRRRLLRRSLAPGPSVVRRPSLHRRRRGRRRRPRAPPRRSPPPPRATGFTRRTGPAGRGHVPSSQRSHFLPRSHRCPWERSWRRWSVPVDLLRAARHSRPRECRRPAWARLRRADRTRQGPRTPALHLGRLRRASPGLRSARSNRPSSRTRARRAGPALPCRRSKFPSRPRSRFPPPTWAPRLRCCW